MMSWNTDIRVKLSDCIVKFRNAYERRNREDVNLPEHNSQK